MDDSGPEAGRRLLIARYTPFQRLNHWITAALFILLAMSGLAMAYPSLHFFSGPFGGQEAARALHPWFGVALVVSFFLLALPFIRVNTPNGDDVRWLRSAPDLIMHNRETLPELGKYNAGQKGVYWAQFVLIPVLLVSGLMIWQQYFGGLTTIGTQRLAVLVHWLAALLAIIVIIVHIYAAIWVKGTMRAMIRGTVTGGWAYRHHRKWLRESLAREAAQKPAGDGESKATETR
jgi:formate dehydrogenase subunit gamma